MTPSLSMPIGSISNCACTSALLLLVVIVYHGSMKASFDIEAVASPVISV